MQSTQFVSVSIILLVMIFTCDSRIIKGNGCEQSRRCNDQCDQCIWGIVDNTICGFEECAKGPGDPCKEDYAECGEGMRCLCGRCHGCSSSIRSIQEICSNFPCLPIKTYHRRQNFD